MASLSTEGIASGSSLPTGVGFATYGSEILKLSINGHGQGLLLRKIIASFVWGSSAFQVGYTGAAAPDTAVIGRILVFDGENNEDGLTVQSKVSQGNVLLDLLVPSMGPHLIDLPGTVEDGAVVSSGGKLTAKLVGVANGQALTAFGSLQLVYRHVTDPMGSFLKANAFGGLGS